MPRSLGDGTRLTQAVQKQICDALELAVPLKYAAEAAGVAESSAYEWLTRGSEGKDPYAAFHGAVTRARAQAVVKLTMKALMGGKGSSAAMWILERRHRADYGPIQKLELTGDASGALGVEIKLDPIGDPTARALLEAALGRTVEAATLRQELSSPR